MLFSVSAHVPSRCTTTRVCPRTPRLQPVTVTYRRPTPRQGGAQGLEKRTGQTYVHISPRDGTPLLTRVLGLPSEQGQRQASLDVLVPVDGRSDAGKDLRVRDDGNGHPCALALHGSPHPPIQGLLLSHRTGELTRNAGLDPPPAPGGRPRTLFRGGRSPGDCGAPSRVGPQDQLTFAGRQRRQDWEVSLLETH